MQQPVQRTLQLSPSFDEQCEHFESVQPAPHQLQMVQDHPQLMLQMVQQMLQQTTHRQQTSLLKIAFHASNLRRTMLLRGATVQHRSPCVFKTPHHHILHNHFVCCNVQESAPRTNCDCRVFNLCHLHSHKMCKRLHCSHLHLSQMVALWGAVC